MDTGNVAARIKAIETQLKAMEKTVARMDRRGNGINDTFKKLDKRMGRMGKAIKGVTGLFTKLFTTLAKFSFLVYSVASCFSPACIYSGVISTVLCEFIRWPSPPI